MTGRHTETPLHTRLLYLQNTDTQTLHYLQGLGRVVVGLLHQAQLLALALVDAHVDVEVLLQPVVLGDGGVVGLCVSRLGEGEGACVGS